MSLNYYRSVDEILGASESRYFGSGYLNTSYVLSDHQVEEKPEGFAFSFTSSIQLPKAWSIKGSVQQKPHLSSIDAIEISIACLTEQVNALLADQPYTVRSITVVAGKEPTEDNLDHLEVRGALKWITPETGSVDLRLANMKARVNFALAHDGIDYHASHRKHALSVDDLMVNLDDLKASALVHPSAHDATHAWSLASCFAASLQIGQVLLYEHDKLSRATSRTLWMRKLTIDVGSALPALTGPQPISVALTNVKQFDMNGHPWRCADITSWVSNTALTCSVAHQIG